MRLLVCFTVVRAATFHTAGIDLCCIIAPKHFNVAGPKNACIHQSTEYLAAAEKAHQYGVNAGIVDHQLTTPEGVVHLAAAGVYPRRFCASAPRYGCVSVHALPPDVQEQRAGLEDQDGKGVVLCKAGNASSGCSAGRCQPQHVLLDTAAPAYGAGSALLALQRHCVLAQPRLLAALTAYQLLCRDSERLLFVDTELGALQRPAHSSAFVALTRSHLECALELLQTQWAFKVRQPHASGTLCVCGSKQRTQQKQRV